MPGRVGPRARLESRVGGPSERRGALHAHEGARWSLTGLARSSPERRRMGQGAGEVHDERPANLGHHDQQHPRHARDRSGEGAPRRSVLPVTRPGDAPEPLPVWCSASRRARTHPCEPSPAPSSFSAFTISLLACKEDGLAGSGPSRRRAAPSPASLRSRSPRWATSPSPRRAPSLSPSRPRRTSSRTSRPPSPGAASRSPSMAPCTRRSPSATRSPSRTSPPSTSPVPGTSPARSCTPVRSPSASPAPRRRHPLRPGRQPGRRPLRRRRLRRRQAGDEDREGRRRRRRRRGHPGERRRGREGQRRRQRRVPRGSEAHEERLRRWFDPKAMTGGPSHARRELHVQRIARILTLVPSL